MIIQESINQLIELSEEYNSESYFLEDPIIFPKHFALLMEGKQSSCGKMKDGYVPTLKDVEIAGIIAAHLAWGRRDMIIRDCKRAFDEMEWQPYNYIMAGKYRDDNSSLHRTI
ncbi:MAG: DUF2400 family protein, partial [Bacteroidales bacterium]|nr:DUF2400 family protein [Bacteroidales bacterium]